MVDPYDAHIEGAAMARDLARRCRAEAKSETGKRKTMLISEARRHEDRADWYISQAQYFIKPEQRKAAA
jgi:hypothetical protein